jgi:hypothetical protein
MVNTAANVNPCAVATRASQFEHNDFSSNNAAVAPTQYNTDHVSHRGWYIRLNDIPMS